MYLRWAVLGVALTAVPLPATAVDGVIDAYASTAKSEAASFSGFSAQRGETLYRKKHAGTQAESCMACHTADPRKPGQHEKTGKKIEPLAPVANAKRFTDPAKVEKWFRRNCREVLGRECTAVEKGDFVTYMRSVK